MQKNNSKNSFVTEVHALLEHAAVVLVLIDEELKVKAINKTGADKFNTSNDKLNLLSGEALNCINAKHNGAIVCTKGKNCSECIIRSSVKKTFETKQNIYQKEGSITIITDNKPHILHVLVSTSILEDEHHPYVLMTLEDITKQKGTELQLAKLIKEKDTLLSVLSHDLRSPFNALIGFSSILHDEIESLNNDQIKEISNHINNVSRSSYHMLDDLLGWINALNGNIKFYPEQISFNKSVDEIIRNLMHLTDNKNIKVIRKNQTDIQLYADQQMLFSVLRNLISNAIKYSKLNGTIDIDVKEHKEDVEISIKDYGVGMSKETQTNLFSDTPNISTRGTKGEKGSGIGIVLCKDFIDQHNGKIWAKSTPGNGSTFYFSLPKYKD